MTFQGKDVQGTRVTLTGGAKELVFGDHPKIDQQVSIQIEGRVTGVDHRVDDKTGDLVEVVRVKVTEIGHVEVLTYPRAVTTPDGVKVDPETGEVLDTVRSA